MRYNTCPATFLILALSIVTCISGCGPSEKYRDETYPNHQYSAEETKYIDRLDACMDSLELWLGEPDLRTFNHESYRLTFISSLGHRIMARLDKKKPGYLMTVKDFSFGNKYDSAYRVRKSWQKEISAEDWKVMEDKIYQNHFWTARRWREPRPVLDGYTLILEGRRPQARQYGKKLYELVVRSSPDEHDETGILFWEIMDYFDVRVRD